MNKKLKDIMSLPTQALITLLCLVCLIVFLQTWLLLWAWNAGVTQAFGANPITWKGAWALIMILHCVIIPFRGNSIIQK